VPDRIPILIAGGGIAGLALARALHKSGLDFHVLEGRAGPGDAGLAINLPGNAITALEQLGIGEQIAGLGRPTRRREYRTDRGRMLFAIDEVAFWGEEMQPRAMRRSDLLALLADGLPPNVLSFGMEIGAVHTAVDAVSVETVAGARLDGDLLIGADGVRSAVRRLAFAETLPRPALLANASWRFLARNPGVDCWTLWAGPESMILLIPLDGEVVYGWMTVPATAGSPAALADSFKRFPAVVRTAVEEAVGSGAALHHSPIEEVRAERWGRDRVLLVGDAAHATAPVWAQGAALALEDALVLANLLASGRDRQHVASVYEEVRRPRVHHVQRMTDRLSRAARMPTIVRGALMPFVGPKSYASTYGPLRTDALASLSNASGASAAPPWS